MSLKKQAASGVKWTGISAAVTAILQFGQVAVLAHILSPSDFGPMGMLLVVIGFAQAFADMGVSNAIIHRQDATREQLSSLYWLNVLSGIAVFGVVWASTPLIVRFYHEPRLARLVFWVALTFLIAPIGQQFQILLQKDLRFRGLAAVEVASTAAGVAISIAAALVGQGVFALIWGQLTNTAARAVMLAAVGWRIWPPELRLRREDLRGYLSFGLYQMGERSINYFSSNVDYLLIGHFLGSRALGIYMVAYQIVVVPMARINPILTRVAFPIFAKRQSNNATLRRGYVEMTELVALLVAPILTGLGVAAPLVIPLFFGERWGEAIPLVQILSVLGVLKALGNPSGPILLAKGRADIGFKWNVFVAATNTVAFWFAAPHGVYAVALSYIGTSCVYFVLLRAILGKVIGLGWAEYLTALVRPLLISAIMGSVTFGIYALLARVSSGLLLLVELAATGIVVLALLSAILERDFLTEAWGLLAHKREEPGQCQG